MFEEQLKIIKEMTSEKRDKEELTTLINKIMLDIKYFRKQYWSTLFLQLEAYNHAPEKVVEFHRVQSEYMSTISEVQLHNIDENQHLFRMIPIWAAYSNILENISDEIQKKCEDSFKIEKLFNNLEEKEND